MREGYHWPERIRKDEIENRLSAPLPRDLKNLNVISKREQFACKCASGEHSPPPFVTATQREPGLKVSSRDKN